MDHRFKRPPGGILTNDRRIIADRQALASDRIDRRPQWADGTAAFAGQVYDGGAMPSDVPRWYLTHPVQFDGGDSEGASYAATADAEKSVPVIVLGHAPAVGDVLIAEMVGGKWVAEMGRGGRKILIDTTWCQNCVTPGTITVTIRAGDCPGGEVVDQGIADADGLYRTHLPDGTYCVSAATSKPGYLNTATAVTLPNGGETIFSQLYPEKLSIYDANTGIRADAFPDVVIPTIGEANPSSYFTLGDSYDSPGYTDPDTGVACAAATVTVYYAWSCNDILLGTPAVDVWYFVKWNDDGTGQCPDDSGDVLANMRWALEGTACYPMSLHGDLDLLSRLGYGVWASTVIDGYTLLTGRRPAGAVSVTQ